MSYPYTRHRRLRSTARMRGLVRETRLSADELIYPIFVQEGRGIKREIPSMPGICNWSLDRVEEEIAEVRELGIPAILLFGVPEQKDEQGSGAYDEEGIVQRATRYIKGLDKDLLIIADTCLCEYTSHGHCGVLCEHRHGRLDVDNDRSLELLARTAVSQAQAGADIIAPSNMMDGYVAATRSALDEAGLTEVPIMAYSVKYASAYYGPFREAAQSAPQTGDRKSYQMDPANVREAIREAESDVQEGADMLMVKPALAYLDVVRMMKEQFDLPLAAYNVSGEYSMVKAAAGQGWINEQAVVMESLLGMKRAGADMIITYHAKDAARWLKQD